MINMEEYNTMKKVSTLGATSSTENLINSDCDTLPPKESLSDGKVKLSVVYCTKLVS